MTTFHSAKVQGLDVFHRQAGDPTKPQASSARRIPHLLPPVRAYQSAARTALQRRRGCLRPQPMLSARVVCLTGRPEGGD